VCVCLPACVRVCVYFRSYLTSYERVIAVGGSRGRAATRRKHKLSVENEERSSDVVCNKSTRKRCDPADGKITARTAACDCHVTADAESVQRTCSRRCRGWFLSSWPESGDSSSGHSSPSADRSVLGVRGALAGRTWSQSAELRLDGSSAAKWSALKRSQREDNEALVSSPAGVLWSGKVKPLVRPSQATSVGKYTSCC